MENNLTLTLAHKEITVADVHEATGIPVETIVDNYLNIAIEEFFSRKMPLVRNQFRQNIVFKELMYRIISVDGTIRKEGADD